MNKLYVKIKSVHNAISIFDSSKMLKIKNIHFKPFRSILMTMCLFERMFDCNAYTILDAAVLSIRCVLLQHVETNFHIYNYTALFRECQTDCICTFHHMYIKSCSHILLFVGSSLQMVKVWTRNLPQVILLLPSPLGCDFLFHFSVL